MECVHHVQIVCVCRSEDLREAGQGLDLFGSGDVSSVLLVLWGQVDEALIQSHLVVEELLRLTLLNFRCVDGWLRDTRVGVLIFRCSVRVKTDWLVSRWSCRLLDLGVSILL